MRIISTSVLVKKLFKGGLILIGVFIFFTLLFNVSVSLMEQRDVVIELGKKVDGAGNWLVGFRAVIAVFIIIMWKELIDIYDRCLNACNMKPLNKRQKFLLKKLHPYVAGALVVTELLGLAL